MGWVRRSFFKGKRWTAFAVHVSRVPVACKEALGGASAERSAQRFAPNVCSALAPPEFQSSLEFLKHKSKMTGHWCVFKFRRGKMWTGANQTVYDKVFLSKIAT